MRSPEGTTPMDINEIENCASCGKPVTSNLTFYEVEIRQCVVDAQNIGTMRSMAGLVGSTAIGLALSPTTTIAHRVGAKTRRLLCQDCGAGVERPLPVAVLLEGGDA
ncbi:hypothetical protein [Hoeflea sp.]|uniref:hypothetical protein n=1 Tax=Hoeflea sp. TaxID=1940281 RepID=UPI003B51BD94